MYVHPIRIGNVEIKNNIFLAPMAGISDMPFRILCKEKGAGLVYTEMITYQISSLLPHSRIMPNI